MLNTYISTFKEQQMPYCAEWNVGLRKKVLQYLRKISHHIDWPHENLHLHLPADNCLELRNKIYQVSLQAGTEFPPELLLKALSSSWEGKTFFFSCVLGAALSASQSSHRSGIYEKFGGRDILHPAWMFHHRTYKICIYSLRHRHIPLLQT